MKRMIRRYHIYAFAFPILLIAICAFDFSWHKSSQEVRLARIFCKSIYLLSNIALTYKIITMFLFFIRMLKQEYNDLINLRKMYCFVCAVGLYLSLTSITIVFDLVDAIVYYKYDMYVY